MPLFSLKIQKSSGTSVKVLKQFYCYVYIIDYYDETVIKEIKTMVKQVNTKER